MKFAYRDDQLLVRDTIRAFVRSRIVPNADRWNEAGKFPMELLPELAALGLTGLAVPQEYGGAGLDAVTIAMLMEEFGAGDGSIGLTIAAHNSLCIGHLLIAASDEQKERWLPPLARGEYLGCWALTEPASGSDALNAQSRGRRDGDGYVIDGTKQFITNASVAGFAVVMAGAGERKLTAFGVMRGTPGFAAGKPEEKMGLHASDTAPLLLQGCRVPERDRIGRDGEAFDDVKKVLDRGRIGIGALAIGLGRASLEVAIRYAKERTQFGRAITEFQMIQWKLARARTELDAARLLVHRAAALADAGRPFTDAASKAKLFASQAGTRAADASLQVLGGYGYLRDFPVERHLRDVRLMEIGEGTSEVQRIVIARDLLRAS
ncbi:MAG: acyl-CoA dehydrogenase [Chloroflexi bacterium]|nr:MAG: acyl-CoA dehydrogenase [Chloroflexota bacterium]